MPVTMSDHAILLERDVEYRSRRCILLQYALEDLMYVPTERPIHHTFVW